MRKMQKKAAVTLLGILIGVIIAALTIPLLIKFGGSIVGLLSAEKDDGGYFESLAGAVKSGEEQQLIYYVSKKHFLAGFEKDDVELKTNGANAIKKPVFQCGKNSCICLCNLKEGEISYDGCYEARCEQLNNIAIIKGITLLTEDFGDARGGKLLIKGRNELPLTIKKESFEQGSEIIFTMPINQK